MSRVSDQVARDRLTAAGISVHSTSGSRDRQRKDATSLDEVRSNTIDQIIKLKQASGCEIVVTGGTEVGHSTRTEKSHYNGYKLDIRLNDGINTYIKNHFTKAGKRAGDNAELWTDPVGNVYALEGNHWDILFN